MPLSAVNFVAKGPVKSADMNQFYNLFTGVMTDQPVTFGNTLQLGGNQSSTTVPLKVYGASGQVTHLLDLYTDHSQSQPGWGIGAAGGMAWGPGGVAPLDTYLSRVAGQNGHSSDTAGILIQPYLEVAGSIQATTYQFPNGVTLTSPSPGNLTVTQDLSVARDLAVSRNATLSGVVSLGSDLNLPNNHWINCANTSGVQHPLIGLAGDNNVMLWNAGGGSIRFVNQGNSAELAHLDNAGNWVTSGAVNTQGIFLPDSGQLVWIDANTRIISSGRAFYFDTYNQSFAFRNSATGFPNLFLLDSGGTGTFANQCNARTFNATANAYYFANNAGIYLQWNGAQLQMSHALMLNAATIYFGTSGSYYLNTSGTNLQAANLNILSWGWVGLSGNAAINMSWNGSQIAFTNAIRVSGYTHSTGQVCAANSYDNGSHGNAFLTQNVGGGNPNGSGLAFVWNTFSCVDHAAAYNLRAEPIADPLSIVRAIQGVSYDHAQFSSDYKEPDRKRDGSINTAPTYGFSAAQVAQYLPELVEADPDGNPAHIDLNRMVVILWEALKQHLAEEHA